MKYTFTKDYLIQKLQQKAKELGRTPIARDMRKPYPSCRKYYEVYNSWDEALIDAGFDVNNKVKYPRKKPDRGEMYTKEKMIEILVNKSKELGRIPSSSDTMRPSTKTYVNKFGSWNKALFEAGLIKESEIESYKGYHPLSGKKIKERSKIKRGEST